MAHLHLILRALAARHTDDRAQAQEIRALDHMALDSTSIFLDRSNSKARSGGTLGLRSAER